MKTTTERLTTRVLTAAGLLAVAVLTVVMAVACGRTQDGGARRPAPSDTERLMGEALEAIGQHDLGTAEQRAYSAAILAADSAEMTDALTMLSLVYMLEEKKDQADMVMAVLPEGQTMEFVRLQARANEQGRSRETAILAGFIVALAAVAAVLVWWNRRKKLAFERKVDELMEAMDQAAAAAAGTLADETAGKPVRADIAKTKQGVDVLYAIMHDENISQMGRREQLAVTETLHIVDPGLAAIISADDYQLTPKETFYVIMEHYGKTDRQKAQCFCCSEQALRSTKSRLGKKLDLETIRKKL